MAWRYLFSRKSHSAVSIIAILSLCGVAVATMAIVCVLSVFNGFRDVIMSRDSRITPDIEITSASAPLLENADSLSSVISKMEGVRAVTPVVIENAVAYHDSRQVPVTLLGVKPEAYRRIAAIDSLLIPPSIFNLSYSPMPEAEEITLSEAEQSQIEATAAMTFDEAALFDDIPADTGQDTADINEPTNEQTPHTLLSIGVASRLGFISPSGEILSPNEDGIVTFVPRRTATLNVANPAASFMADSLSVSGVFESDQGEFDSQTIIIDLELARRLLEYDNNANAIYVAAQSPAAAQSLNAEITEKLGDGYHVKDRLEQQTMNYRMISIEKWVTFLLLSFILLIASFNVISTLSMLILEKRNNIYTLSRIGASRSMIGSIFFWESIFVNTIGVLSGILIGLLLCYLQQNFGLIKMSGDTSTLIVTNYPVKVQLTDLLFILLPSAAVSALVGIISARFAKRLLTN